MKANELRIRNYVYDEFDLLVEFDLDCFIGYSDGYYKPIPLTEDWLLKFGFEKKLDENGYSLVLKFKTTQEVFTKVVYEHNFIGLYLDKNMNKGFYGFRFSNIDYKYVHQLQNLYFALTGEELTIKTQRYQ